MNPFPFQLKYVLKKTIPGQPSFHSRLPDARAGVSDDYDRNVGNLIAALRPQASGALTGAQLSAHARAIRRLEGTRELAEFPRAFAIMQTPLWELMRQVRGSGTKRQAYEEMVRENHHSLVLNYHQALERGELPENAPALPGKWDPALAYQALIDGRVRNPQAFAPYRSPIVFFHERALNDLHAHLERGNAEALPPQTGDGPPLPTYADMDENGEPVSRRARHSVPLETSVTLLGRRHIDPATGLIASEVTHAIPGTSMAHLTGSVQTYSHSPQELDAIIEALKGDPTLGVLGDVHSHPATATGMPSGQDVKYWHRHAKINDGGFFYPDPFAIFGVFTSPTQRIPRGFDVNALRAIEGLGPVSQRDFMDPQDFRTFLEAQGSRFDEGGVIGPAFDSPAMHRQPRNDFIADALELYAGHLQPVGTHSLTTRFFEDRPTHRYAQSIQVLGNKPTRTNFNAATRNAAARAGSASLAEFDDAFERTRVLDGITVSTPKIGIAPWNQIDPSGTNADVETGRHDALDPTPTIIRKEDSAEAPVRIGARLGLDRTGMREARMVSYRDASRPASQS